MAGISIHLTSALLKAIDRIRRCGKQPARQPGTAHRFGSTGTIAAGNLLIKNGQLSAVIDFGCSGVGDPACDVTIAWTLFSGESRKSFYLALPVDSATWARGRGWALWKGLITLAEHRDTNSVEAGKARRVIDEVLADHTHGI